MSEPVIADEIERPATVTAACALTAIVTTFGFAILCFVGYGLRSDKDSYIEDLGDADDLHGLTPEGVYTYLQVMLGILLLWTLIAFVLAILAYRGSNVARLALVVSSVICAGLSLLAILTVVPIITMVCATAVVVMLTSRTAKDWYANRRS